MSDEQSTPLKKSRSKKPKNPNLRCKAYKFRLYPRDAQRDVHLKRNGSRPFFVVSMGSELKRNCSHIASKQAM